MENVMKKSLGVEMLSLKKSLLKSINQTRVYIFVNY
jgi:hypothetical protein